MTAVAIADQPVPTIQWSNLWWVAASAVITVVVVQSHDFWLLNFVHVLSGLMWTGIDLFMGFVIGPIMRRLDPAARRAFTMRLMPRMLFIMPTLAAVASTAGWFLAVQRGYLDLPFPALWWVIAALLIVTILTIQGFAILLPTNIRVYLELRGGEPDMAKIGRLMRLYIVVVASQGVMQIGIIVVMARFATGL